MNNKYYTPAIEEFHIGFEFEYKSKNDDWDKIDYDNWMHPREDKYLKHCTESELLRSFNFIDQCIKRNELRVKYLDGEDISNSNWIDGYLGIIEILEYRNTGTVLKITNRDGIVVFYGVIKNKSELKRLLQQLNIK